MNDPVVRIPVGEWADAFISWLTSTFSWLFQLVKTVLEGAYDFLANALGAPPFYVVAVILVAIAFLARGWKLAAGSAVGLFVIYGMGLWSSAMDTLALVLLASFIALAIGIPLGIWAARNATVSRILRPVMDFLQTLPAFVYLIPTVIIFLTGAVPGIVATVIFAIAPGVRFTELGIRQVDSEVVEAGEAFGSSRGRILRQIQIPLAMPTIMAGVNQVIMLALSMVVVAGLVGAGGLGNDVVSALQRVRIGPGFEAGLAVVILAIFLDRVTAGLGERSPVARAAKASRA
ncbi:binding-protein-dependent transport systems inner membrane component [Beutenbergia cavernae DSM 12333]|uniref:Binding-protein-dependent transport systems inner membrane component n=1 Tax=Beutenbergia cavernae (strain ATCC BAA-8 / DSM 12333 / CCUG 43141 / JCM 11478 / NBRC 16432 / NCIMB 13614 / HKI 0122) TaxID=471853 RepID=C5C1L8_BEUC1|nr:ABC transporter permease subunit [Beutenbergia cavernae]ACQ79486.1 binding-protein-dependent transport systems inner membrane component [Beutenbergia cavernae DSM 12333]